MWYDIIASSYKELYGDEQKQKIKWFLKNFNFKKTHKILDLACGSGLFNVDSKIIGLDKSFQLLKQSKFSVINGIAEQLPFQNKSFDVIFCLSAIHNFDNPEKSIKEMLRVGRKWFLLSVLKKSKLKHKLLCLIKNYFIIKKKYEEEKDILLVCSQKSAE
ncbi:class I SAM-dependent methyltransferase [Candidatus Woesearchaeota archaeon]|nr:class I SAM-dependent methyltransferase [Candidatus Woesearchaeota archaeon]